MIALSPDKQAALETLAQYFKPSIHTTQFDPTKQTSQATRPDFINWSEHNFYLPETEAPIVFFPHQKIIFDLFFGELLKTLIGFLPLTYLFSTIKKSGKTAISADVAQYVATNYGRHQEVYCLASDEESARGRAYQAVLTSLEAMPGYKNKSVNAGYVPGLWNISENEVLHLPSHSKIKALNSDYRGNSGSNPTATIWTELWTYQSEASKKLWSELTPVPTRDHSFRFVETYAGYTGESEILEDLWELAVKYGRQLTIRDIPAWGLLYPNEGELTPFYVNEAARVLAYIDTGVRARRMPWQTDSYYEAEAHDLSDDQFRRLHNNEWVSATSPLMPIQWYDSCVLSPTDSQVKPLDANTPIILGVDAAVSSDCCAVSAVSRYNDLPGETLHRFSQVWAPPKGGTINYGETIEPYLREICAKYNVVEIAYDVFQLHDLMTRLSQEGVAWTRPFSQMNSRLEADYALVTSIRDRRHHIISDHILREHFTNASKKYSSTEDTKFRIIKKSKNTKIDDVIAESMARAECLRLNI